MSLVGFLIPGQELDAERPKSGDWGQYPALFTSVSGLPERDFFFNICLDTHIRNRVYKWSGIRIRNYRGAEPPGDLEPPDLVRTVGGRDRTPASNVATDRVEAPASAARRRLRRIDGRRTAPSVPAEARTISGGRYVAGSVPPVLVRSRRCPRTPPRPHGPVSTTETENESEREDDAAQPPHWATLIAPTRRSIADCALR